MLPLLLKISAIVGQFIMVPLAYGPMMIRWPPIAYGLFIMAIVEWIVFLEIAGAKNNGS